MLLNLTEVPSFLVTLFIFAWLGTITFLLVRLISTFGKLTKGAGDKNLKEILESLLDEVKKEKEIDLELKKSIEKIELEGQQHIQKIGFIRFNPFAETGGNQSFILAVLDGNNSGFVLTSLHSRESTRIFSKPVKEGKEDGFEFSKEEIQAVVAATKKKKVS